MYDCLFAFKKRKNFVKHLPNYEVIKKGTHFKCAYHYLEDLLAKVSGVSLTSVLEEVGLDDMFFGKEIEVPGTPDDVFYFFVELNSDTEEAYKAAIDGDKKLQSSFLKIFSFIFLLEVASFLTVAEIVRGSDSLRKCPPVPKEFYEKLFNKQLKLRLRGLCNVKLRDGVVKNGVKYIISDVKPSQHDLKEFDTHKLVSILKAKLVVY